MTPVPYDIASELATLATDIQRLSVRVSHLAAQCAVRADDQPLMQPTRAVNDTAPTTLTFSAPHEGPLCDVCSRPRVVCMGCHDEPPSVAP